MPNGTVWYHTASLFDWEFMLEATGFKSQFELEDEQKAEQQEHDHDGHEPVFLFLLEKLPELGQYPRFTHEELLHSRFARRSCSSMPRLSAVDQLQHHRGNGFGGP